MSFAADSEAPIIALSAKKHFEDLDPTHRFYAHHLSRASHYGTRAVLRSVSPESEQIYDLILTIHRVLGAGASNEHYAAKLGLSDEIVTGYLEYASQFLSNLGNFKSFGDKKFVPRIPLEQFDVLIRTVNDLTVSELYANVRDALYDTERGLLGWPEEGQLSSYYLGNKIITKPEVEAVNAAIAKAGIMPENTRVKKVSDTQFVVHVASAETVNTTSNYPQEAIVTEAGAKITFKFGDHSKEFKHIVEELTAARNYVANETQGKLIDYYVEAFKTGSMNAHKKSQIEWVKDLQPQVESNIGFIETYRDPSGVRGEWEGLVAMVNKDRTAKFSKLVENATSLISLLPWEPFYEKDTFNPPDFTSLEVLTFAGSGIPAGINIPNYDDVRLKYGFKNVSLGNVLSANPKNPKKAEVVSFIGDEVKDVFKKWRDDAFEVQVGLHELLGHGSGKLLQETAPGEFNFNKSDPRGTSYYKPNETWGSLFGLTAGSFEECRAELVALYLMLKVPEKVFPIFGIDDQKEQDEVKFVGTVLMCRAGLLSLEFWDPTTKIWGQAHMRARFGIFKSLFQAGVCSLAYDDTEKFSDLKLVVDETKLASAGVEALGNFLLHLHKYKSTANVKDGVAFYQDITGVTPDFSRFRDVVLDKKLPRKQYIQANTTIQNDSIEVKEYEESEAGMIQSFFDRHV